MDKLVLVSGLLLFLAGLMGVVYGVGVNVPGMVVRGATNYSGIRNRKSSCFGQLGLWRAASIAEPFKF